MSNTRRRLITAVGCFLGGLILTVPPALSADEGYHVCSSSTLRGSYGFVTGGVVVPANTPRGVVGRWDFDGQGNFKINSLTVSNDGTILHLTDAGTYTVNSDCTGTILPVIGGGSIDIVIVDNGNEFYQLRTAPENLVLIFSAAKKQFPRKNDDH